MQKVPNEKANNIYINHCKSHSAMHWCLPGNGIAIKKCNNMISSSIVEGVSVLHEERWNLLPTLWAVAVLVLLFATNYATTVSATATATTTKMMSTQWPRSDRSHHHVLRTRTVSELKGNCEGLLEQYATITANFTRCVIRNARPIRICESCISEFLNVIKSHNDILKLKEDSGEACRKELLNMDRLDLIEASFKFVNGEWNKASCQKCLVKDSDNSSSTINQITADIFEIRHQVADCWSNADARNLSGLCDRCRNVYCKLNSFYDEHGSHKGFCMDVIDMMNSTRYDWSRKYNCSTVDERSEFIFFASSLAICALPIIFYFMIWFFAKYSFPEISSQNRWSRRFDRVRLVDDADN